MSADLEFTAMQRFLESLEGQAYPRLKALAGHYYIKPIPRGAGRSPFSLRWDWKHVQADPYASPSMVEVSFDAETAKWPVHCLTDTRPR